MNSNRRRFLKAVADASLTPLAGVGALVKKHGAHVLRTRRAKPIRLFETFKRARTKRPDDPAFLITAGDRSLPISWRHFTDDIAIIAFIIDTNRPQGPVALLGENSYDWIVAHAACLFSGVTVVPLDVNLSAGDIVERLASIQADTLVYSSLYSEKAADVAARRPGLRIAAFGSRKTDVYINAARQAVELGLPTLWERPAPDAAHAAMILFTSGTTSRPRPVLLTARGIEVFCDSWSAALDMKIGDRSLMVLPLYHIFGLCATYLMLVNGVSLGVCPDFRRLYDAVERFRARFLFLVPALAEILAVKIARHAPNAEAALGSPLDWILTGGAPQPRRTYDKLARLGVRVITAYGLTETSALYAVSPVAGPPRPGSAGRVVRHPEIETRVSDDGELLIRGPNVFKGYLGMASETAAVLTDEGWFHTGDTGEIDGDGFVWITGRRARTIVLDSGKKVAPEELEERLVSIPGIHEALVTGDGAAREIIATLYGTLDEAAAEKAVGELNRQLPVYQRITRVHVRTTPFPRTASGKIKLGPPDELQTV
jgi:long-subunit acyl-CoA synthetase (AMP-forming)